MMNKILLEAALKAAQSTKKTDRQKAVEILNQLLTNLETENLSYVQAMNIPLHIFLDELSTRTAECIRDLFFSWVCEGKVVPPLTTGHLLMISKKQLLSLQQFGKTSLAEVEQKLEKLGLKLFEQHDEKSIELLVKHGKCYANWQNINDEEREGFYDSFFSNNINYEDFLKILMFTEHILERKNHPTTWIWRISVHNSKPLFTAAA